MYLFLRELRTSHGSMCSKKKCINLYLSKKKWITNPCDPLSAADSISALETSEVLWKILWFFKMLTDCQINLSNISVLHIKNYVFTGKQRTVAYVCSIHCKWVSNSYFTTTYFRVSTKYSYVKHVYSSNYKTLFNF